MSDIGNVLISLNQEAAVLSISYYDGDKESQLFKIIDIPLSDIDSKTINDAQSIIGSAILNTFHSMMSVKIGVGTMSDEGGDAIERAFSIILEKAEDGDAEAQNAIASKYLSDSIEKLDTSYLDKADEWFRKSAENGYDEAERFLEESWEEIKEAYVKRINKGKAA